MGKLVVSILTAPAMLLRRCFFVVRPQKTCQKYLLIGHFSNLWWVLLHCGSFQNTLKLLWPEFSKHGLFRLLACVLSVESCRVENWGWQLVFSSRCIDDKMRSQNFDSPLSDQSSVRFIWHSLDVPLWQYARHA